MNKKVLATFILIGLTLLSGCASAETGGTGEDRTIKIGVTGGPPEEITNIVKEEAAKEGINLEIVEFNDYITPNRVLDEGELDLNMFQTKQFLEQYVEDRESSIVPIGTTYNSGTAIYSEKYDDVDEIPKGATLGVINDPVNIWRSLLLYEEAGLLTVASTEGLSTLQDIEENPKKFELKEIEGPLMYRTLSSIDAGIVANTHALDQGVDPKEEAIYLEDGLDFPMVLAAREEDREDSDYLRVVELYHSETVEQFIEERYKDILFITDDPFEFE